MTHLDPAYCADGCGRLAETERLTADGRREQVCSEHVACQRFVHTEEPDMDWVCVCGHDTDWHNYGPSKPGGPCEACAESGEHATPLEDR